MTVSEIIEAIMAGICLLVMIPLLVTVMLQCFKEDKNKKKLEERITETENHIWFLEGKLERQEDNIRTLFKFNKGWENNADEEESQF